MIVKTNDIHYKNIAKTMANRSDAGASLLRSEYPNGILPSEMPDIIAEIVSREYQNGYNFGKEEGRQLGYNEGKEVGIVEGVEIGRKAEYNEFWDAYQADGTITSANYMFAFSRWNDNTFKPKYSMTKMTNAGNMFNTCGVTDLKAALERQNVVFDFSNCTNFAQAFSYSQLTVLPIINCTKASSMNGIFQSSKQLRIIEAWILKDDGSQTFYNCLNLCESLENIVVEGTIGQNGLNLQWSKKLSAASIESIINALSDTTRDLTVTLSLAAVNKAFETAQGANDGSDSVSWRFLRGTKPYWNIALV